MFKRSTKLTALLVAAASVASTVPAMAATKLATKDGTIENAVAYKDGKYLYEGYRSDDDENGLYISDGSEKDKALDDADEIDKDYGKFGNKYVSVKDGSDFYVVDLETGKITDEDTADDLALTAKTKLKTKLDNTERYENIEFEDDVLNADENFTNGKNQVKRVSSNKLEDEYYIFNAETKDGDNGFGYTNGSGKYIDCSYDLNLYAYATTSGSNGKMYKIEDVEDTAEVEDGYKISVDDVEFVKYIGQDDKYIYSVIKVDLVGAQIFKPSNNGVYEDVEDYYDNNIDEVTSHYYVQKVSKEQGDKKDDAYKPKDTQCFEIAPEDVLGNGNVNDAYNALLLKGDFATKTTKYAVVDGVIYAYFEDDSDKIKIFKIALRTSEKLDRFKFVVEDGESKYKKDTNSSKISGHVARKDGDKDHDMTEVEDNNQPWTIDTNGTLWFIDEGKIYKSVKMGDFEEVYTCDRSLNCIDVYDEDNLIAWDSDGDVYTTVGEGSKAAEEEAKDIVKDTVEDTTTEPVVTTKTGWDKLADGTWNLYDATGAKVTGWANVGGVWYYMDPTTAVMKTGWVNDNGTWYYCNASGAMQTGWVNDNGTWYYCNASGAMQTGWLNDNGTWYYLNANGSMAANTTVDGYVLGANGAWIR